MRDTLSSRFVAANLVVYGLAHAAVDAACAMVVFTSQKSFNLPLDDFFYLVLTYNILAFGSQPFWGRIVDAWREPRKAAVAGCLIVVAGVVSLGVSPILAIGLVGIGNALFHIGGGTISLNLTPNRASAPGIFVAPGAIGLAAGIMAGKMGLCEPWIFILLLLAPCAAMFMIRVPSIDYDQSEGYDLLGALGLVIVLLLLSVGIRSFIGFTVQFPWKSDLALLAILTLAVAVGKGVGGVLADRYGWMRIAVGALVLSSPLLAFCSQVPALAIPGIFLFNMTMAVTLTATAQAIPGRPGFAFGLTCLALIIGALPTFTEQTSVAAHCWFVLPVIITSAVVLWLALMKLPILRASVGQAFPNEGQ